MLLSEENKSTCYRLEGRRLHLCLVECVYLFIKVERAGYFLKVRVPSSYPFSCRRTRGADPMKDAWWLRVLSFKIFKLYVARLKYSWSILCEESLDRGANVAFFPLMCVQYVHRCFGSGGASSAERKRRMGGWQAEEAGGCVFTLS